MAPGLRRVKSLTVGRWRYIGGQDQAALRRFGTK
jgi:hypothetical protein